MLALRNRFLITIIVLATITLTGFSIDVYVPSLPVVSNYFKVPISLTQLTISSYLIGYGGIQFLIGPIIDAVGRRKPYIFVMLIYIVASFFIPHSENIFQLIILRFIQGAAMGAGSSAIRAIIPDIFDGIELYKTSNYITIAWAIGPIIAPAIGGYLQHFFGWQSAFYFLLTYAIILFLGHLIIVPETIKHRHSLNIRTITYNYKMVLSNLEFCGGVISMGLLYSIFILFGIVAPFLIENTLKLSVIRFGQIALLMGLAWFLGNMTNRGLISTSTWSKIKLPLCIMFLVILVTTIVNLYFFNIYTICIPFLILLYFGGIVFPNYFANNVAIFPKNAGIAGALMGGGMLLVSGVFGSGIGIFLNISTQTPLDLVIFCFLSVCLIIYKIIHPKH